MVRRRWDRKAVPGGVAARIGDLPATVVNLSYGGLCFKAPVVREGDVPIAFDISFPDANLSVPAARVWVKRARPSDIFWCGVAVADDKSPTWRGFVDRVGGVA